MITPQIEALGGQWLQLDLDSPKTKQNGEAAIKEAERIDVVVSNAGYSILKSVEDMSEEEIHHQFNTNVYGPIRIIKAALPYLHSQKSGTVINGMDILIWRMFIGFSKALQAEVALCNIHVLLVEPGGFRTKNILGAFVTLAAGLTKDYEGTVVEGMLKYPSGSNGKQPGDSVKAAARVIEVVNNAIAGHSRTGLLTELIGEHNFAIPVL
ncbi:hypothetical protein DTO169E5_315 [Paecilomyces variotii]|nr:hypothetical protein DTO169E5_315 [Paecilomyces variotii]